MTEETQENHIDYIGDGTGKLVASARPKQTSMPTTSSPTVTLPYHQREWIHVEPGQCDKRCFEVSKKMIRLLRPILQYFEKTTEQSNSESLHRCFVQNLRLLSFGQFEHGWVSCKEQEVLRRDSNSEWIPVHLKLFCAFEQLWAIVEVHILFLHCKTTCCYRTTSLSTSVMLEAPTTYTWDKYQEREACGVLHSRTSDVRWSAHRSRVRPDEAQNCSVQKTVGKYSRNTVFHTDQRKLKLFLLMQVYAWMGSQLSIFGIWLLKCSILLLTNERNPKERVQGNLSRDTPSSKHVSSNAKSSQFGAMLNSFKDIEAVIKMVIKGKNPTMSHVSRTHRVALDWLCDRINLDPKI